MANYCYDAWGRITEITGDRTIADINPIRYRSYYYDKEIELYYLNSRYYSPDTFRFINADEYVQTGQGILDKNMFAYCANNPVSRIDSTGNCWFDANGNWRHDNWEYIGGYERKPNPLLAAKDTSSGKVLICKSGTSATAPRGTVIVYDNRKQGPKKNNNFEVQSSCHIIDELQQREICQAIIDYNNENPEDYEWNREIDTMLVEWDWHNNLHKHNAFTSHTESVNFDMGLGTDSTFFVDQIIGYFIGYLF